MLPGVPVSGLAGQVPNAGIEASPAAPHRSPPRVPASGRGEQRVPNKANPTSIQGKFQSQKSAETLSSKPGFWLRALPLFPIGNDFFIYFQEFLRQQITRTTSCLQPAT